MSEIRTLIRLEGVLLPPHAFLQSAFLASGSPGRLERAARLGGLALGLPAMGLLRLGNRQQQRRWANFALAGLGQDRVALLAQEFSERFLTTRVAAEGQRLLDRARSESREPILLSHGLREAVLPVCAELGVEAVHAAELELRDGRATGKLLEPDVERVFADLEEQGINLDASYGYGSDAADRTWLGRCGYPCAVNPDRALRLEAEREGWPILDYSWS